MNRISCTRLGALAALLFALLGAAACDSQGCGQEEIEEASTKAPTITCGPGTVLQAGQCVSRDPVITR